MAYTVMAYIVMAYMVMAFAVGMPRGIGTKKQKKHVLERSTASENEGCAAGARWTLALPRHRRRHAHTRAMDMPSAMPIYSYDPIHRPSSRPFPTLPFGHAVAPRRSPVGMLRRNGGALIVYTRPGNLTRIQKKKHFDFFALRGQAPLTDPDPIEPWAAAISDHYHYLLSVIVVMCCCCSSDAGHGHLLLLLLLLRRRTDRRWRDARRRLGCGLPKLFF